MVQSEFRYNSEIRLDVALRLPTSVIKRRRGGTVHLHFTFSSLRAQSLPCPVHLSHRSPEPQQCPLCSRPAQSLPSLLSARTRALACAAKHPAGPAAASSQCRRLPVRALVQCRSHCSVLLAPSREPWFSSVHSPHSQPLPVPWPSRILVQP